MSRLDLRTWSFAMRLAAVMILLVVTALTGTAFFTLPAQQAALAQQIGATMREQALGLGDVVAGGISHKLVQIQSLATIDGVIDTVKARNESYTYTVDQIHEMIRERNAAWPTLPDNDPLVVSVLTPDDATNSAAHQLYDFAEVFSDFDHFIIVDRYGALLAATDRPEAYDQSQSEWWQAAWNDGVGAVYVSPLLVDPVTKQHILIFAVPIVDLHAESSATPNKAIGVLCVRLKIDELFNQVASLHIGQSGHAVLLDAAGDVLFDPIAGFEPGTGALPANVRRTFVTPEPGFALLTDEHNDLALFAHAPVNGARMGTSEQVAELQIASAIDRLQWTILVRQEASEAFGNLTVLITNALIIGALTIVGVTLVSFFLARAVTRRLTQLGVAADRIASGDFNAPLPPEGPDEVGRLTASFNHMVDQVQRALAETEHRRQEVEQVNRTLDSVLEHMPVMLFMKDAQTLRFVRFNQAGEDITGLRREQLLGQSDQDLFPREQAERFQAADREILARQGMVDIPEEPVATVHQGTRWLHTRKVAILGPDGQPLYLLGMSEDITEQKRAEESLREYAAQLEARNAEIEALNAFSGNVAHDLKTPLTAIIGTAELLNHFFAQTLSDQAQIFLKRIVQNGRRMTGMIDSLLLLARLRHDDLRVAVTIEELDMVPVVQSMLESVEYLIDNTAAVVEVPEQWPTVLGYGPWITQVWTNYVSNAIKYGGRPPLVALGADAPANGMVRFWVRDNGAGLTPESRAQLFVPFNRLPTHQRAEGHGLGLTIVERIVTRLGGQVGAESIVGQGSLFWFSLPCPPPLDEQLPAG